MKIEDVPVNISTPSTPTQMILAWSLLGALLLWLVIFAVLAVRAQHIEQNDVDELPTPAGSFPAITLQVVSQPDTLAQAGLAVSSLPVSLAPVSSHSGRVLPQTDHSD